MAGWIRSTRAAAAALGLLALALPAHGYIDLAPTLPKIINDSSAIALMEVTAFDRESRVVTLKSVRTLKGAPPAEVRHALAAPGGALPVQLLRWAMAGNRALLFAAKTRAIVCVGTAWYPVRNSDGKAWVPDAERPDLPLSYFGSVSRLTAGVADILAGKSAVITTVAYGADSEGAMFDIALNRQSLPGVVRVQRIRASKTMPTSMLTASSDPNYFVGHGVVDKRDLPALIEELKHADALQRAEAAEEVGTLGRAGRPAASALAEMLKDASPQVRSAAAAALLRIDPRKTGPVDTLSADLQSSDAGTRVAAAAAAGFAGPSGRALAPRLAELLKDPEEAVRLEALQSLSMLGTAAVDALPALLPLVDDPTLAIDAADAIGRIGAPARSALPRLAKLLDSDQSAVRWAAVRAMAQIGGPGARPALDFILKAMPKATEVEGYNLMIYLALLGPEAKEALPRAASFQIKNGMLRRATTWVIDPQGYPWKPPGNSLGFTFPGFGPLVPRNSPDFGAGGGMQGNLFENLLALMFASYIHNLGDRLAPVAPRLAQDIMKDEAGDIPPWGYELLAADARAALDILTPQLKSEKPFLRERAAVAIGYMGPAASDAASALAAARDQAATESERRLLEWALRHVSDE
jgi:HEAT repeat protein